TAPIKPPLKHDTITLEEGLKLLEYPKKLGVHKRKNIMLYKGQYGYYLKYGSEKISLNKINISNEDEINALLNDEKCNEKIIQLINDSDSKYLWKGHEGKTEYCIL